MGKKKKKKKKSKGVLAGAADALSDTFQRMSTDGAIGSGLELGQLATMLAALLAGKEDDGGEKDGAAFRARVEEIVDERVREAMRKKRLRKLVRREVRRYLESERDGAEAEPVRAAAASRDGKRPARRATGSTSRRTRARSRAS